MSCFTKDQESSIQDYWREREDFNKDASARGISSQINPANTLPLPLVYPTALLGVKYAYYALADHQHTHGDMPGGTMHAIVTSLAAGFVPAFGNVITNQVLTVVNGVIRWVTNEGMGNVIGPSSSIDGNIVLFDGVSGTAIKDSGVNLSALVTPAEHETLRQLIHFIDQGPAGGFATGAYAEQLPTGNPFPTSKTWYVDATKAKKIVDQVVTRNANKTIATSQWRVYAVDGSTVLETVTDTISYSGVTESSRSRAIS
jgi:hypothetical protein